MGTSTDLANIALVRFAEQPVTPVPATPDGGFSGLFMRADGLYIIDDAGLVTGPMGAGSSTDAIILDPDSSVRNLIQPTTGDYVPLTIKGYNGTNAANLFQAQEGVSGSNVFVIEDNGISYHQAVDNSTASFRVRNSAGTAIFQVDTQNARIGINTTPTYDFHAGPGSSAWNIYNAAGNMTINSAPISSNYDLLLGGDGVLALQETTTPTADTDYGKVYTKNDNKLYFQDGAGSEHEIAFV